MNEKKKNKIENEIKINASDSAKEDNEIIATFKETIDIPDGLHSGNIVKIEKYSGEFNYLRIGVFPDIDKKLNIDTEKIPVLTVGYPLNLSYKSELGKLLQSINIDIENKTNYTLGDFKKMLIGKRIQFQTVTKTSENGTFSNIIRETVKVINS